MAFTTNQSEQAKTKVAVRGKVTTKDGQPVAGLPVTVVLFDYLPSGATLNVASAVTRQDGRYEATFDPAWFSDGDGDEVQAALHLQVGAASEAVFGQGAVYLAQAVAKGGASLDAIVPLNAPDTDGQVLTVTAGSPSKSSIQEGEVVDARARPPEFDGFSREAGFGSETLGELNALLPPATDSWLP